jgi:hypothetical protein
MYPEPFLAVLTGFPETKSSSRLLDLQWPRFRRTAGDAAPFEVREGALLNHVVGRHPDDKSGHYHGRHDVSADDESGMRSEVHDSFL